METWPYILLPVPQEAVEVELSNNCIRTEMESGFIRQRKRFERQSRTFAVKWSLTDPQMAVFNSFVRWKLKNGSLEFLMDMTQGDGGLTENGPVRLVNGNYSASYSEGRWLVSAKVEVQIAQPISEAALDAYLELAAEGLTIEKIIELTDRLHTLVHQKFPATLAPL